MSDQTVTLESAIALVKYATLQPLAGTTNLLRLVNNPEVWLAKIWPRAPTGFLKLSLSLLLCAGVLRSANNLLSWAVLNNFRRDRYNWRRELVVVTGGSGGLGDLLVRKLAKHSIKVISLDITPPKIPLRWPPLRLRFFDPANYPLSSFKRVFLPGGYHFVCQHRAGCSTDPLRPRRSYNLGQQCRSDEHIYHAG